MKKLLFLIFILYQAGILFAQNSTDTIQKQLKENADDPSNFSTRIEVFNELQHYKSDINIDQTVFRTITKLGKRFTTRVDLPYVHNSFNAGGNIKQSGIGDISFRLLGYQIISNPKSAITASIELSLNTAESPILGTGKNLIIPVVTYSGIIAKKKMLYSLVFQQTITTGGDEERPDVNFSKVQFILIKNLSRKSWVVLAPEWYLNYVRAGLSMNLRSRFAYAPKPRINIWVSPSAGVFGDFVGRYQWSVDIGTRFFLLRKTGLKERVGKL